MITAGFASGTPYVLLNSEALSDECHTFHNCFCVNLALMKPKFTLEKLPENLKSAQDLCAFMWSVGVSVIFFLNKTCVDFHTKTLYHLYLHNLIF